jgi:branched-chain amino acid transport system substrate-binding protein
MADDSWNPDQSAQAAAKLIKDDKVFALVGNTSIVDCAVNQGLYEAEDVIVIAGVGVARECFFAKNYAPTNQGPRLSNLSPAIYANKTFGAKKIVCIAANIPGSEWGCNGIADWGKGKGVELHTILFSPDGLDATSTMLEAMSYKPDVIDILMIEPFAVAMFQAAEQQGLGDKVHWIGAASLYNASIPPAIGKYWSDRLYVGLEFQPLENDGPDNQNWLAVLKKYAAPDTRHDTFSQSGYLGARILTEALLKLDPAKIDRKTVTAALRQIKDFKSDILCAPWYFGPGIHHNANHAGVVDEVSNGGFKTVAKCFNVDDPELSDLSKIEAEGHLAE